MTDEQKCITDLTSLLMDITDKKIGTFTICRISYELFEKHGDVIRAAFRAKEMEENNNRDLARKE